MEGMLLQIIRLLSDLMLLASTSCSSSRSHAIFTITITRTVVEVLNELSLEFKAKVGLGVAESAKAGFHRASLFHGCTPHLFMTRRFLVV